MNVLMKNGFSLIEVLVSILVLAIGVIGSAGMQLVAMRTSQQSAFQTVALHLATEMADAMQAAHRSNPQLVSNDPFVGIDYKAATDGEPSAPAKLCYANECNVHELAEFEIYDWKTRISSALPGARITVCRDSSSGNGNPKKLTWDCDGGSESNAPLVIKLGWQAKNPDGSLIRDVNKAFPPSVVLAVSI